MTSLTKRAIYLCGLAGSPGPSPAIQMLQADGWEIVIPDVPGFNGKTGFMPPDNYMDWLTIFWDAIDATGALPCPIIGASVGAMMAAELAIFRPEAVTAVVLLGAFGIADANNMGQDIYALPSAERSAHLFSKGVPEAFTTRFSELGPDEAPVAKYLSDVAAANMLWPLGDRGLIKRHHRITCPKLIMHGELDELIPVSTARMWGRTLEEITVVPGAGHLLEWDTPEVVGTAITTFLTRI
jgi:pimeloyl-ACP methyl ester carboxylesterase